MKPRIHKYKSVLWDWVEWRCIGSGRAGFGRMPYYAYWDWKLSMKKAGK